MMNQASFGRVQVRGAIIFSGKRQSSSFGSPVIVNRAVKCHNSGGVILPKDSPHYKRALSLTELKTCKNVCRYACQK
jgi:hypothetical protein